MSCFPVSSVQKDLVPSHYSFQALQAFFQLTALTQMNTPHTSKIGVIPKPKASFTSMILPATTPLHHTMGQTIPSSLGSTYSLQKDLSSALFFQPLQESGVPQSWRNVKPCSGLKRFRPKTGLPPQRSYEDRLS